MGFKEIIMQRIRNGQLSFGKRNNGEPKSERPVKKSRSNSLKNVTVRLPDETVANILAFCPISINVPMNKAISKALIKLYKDTIIKKLLVNEQTVNALSNSDITHLFHKLNDESTPH